MLTDWEGFRSLGFSPSECVYRYVRALEIEFCEIVSSVQYRALAEKAADAFYKLSNTRAQIQAYVFDGMDLKLKLVTKFPEP